MHDVTLPPCIHTPSSDPSTTPPPRPNKKKIHTPQQPLGWVVAAEVFPQRLRGKGMTITTMANWLTNFLIAKTVPLVSAVKTQGG